MMYYCYYITFIGIEFRIKLSWQSVSVLYHLSYLESEFDSSSDNNIMYFYSIMFIGIEFRIERSFIQSLELDLDSNSNINTIGIIIIILH